MAINFSQETIFLPSDKSKEFSADEKTQMLKVMQDAYDGSATAKNMFDYWVTPPPNGFGKKITIKFNDKVDFSALTNGSGLITINPAYLTNASYIGLDGTAIKDILATALIHELGHALRFYKDDWQNYVVNNGKYTADYKGDNVTFVNKIYKEMGLPQQLSYTAYDSTATILKPNYRYTNGTSINAAVALETKILPANKNWSSVALGNSNDLLIGGPSANALQSGAGDDFLFGGGRNDTLDGGAGKDTAVYFGSCRDYKIDKNKDGSWTVRGKGSQVNAGTDMLRNIEFVQFDDPKKPGKKQTFELKSGGLKCQTDVAFVIDTTKNTLSPGLTDLIQEFDPPDRVVSSLDTSKVLASSLIDAIYADPNSDVHTGVVAFNDTTIGSPSQVILLFTDQDNFADRKTAVIAAINRLTASDGGDIPETPFDGLRLALNGSMGEWRYGAGTRQIFLFTDAPAKDYALADEVTALDHNIGAKIGSSSAVAVRAFQWQPAKSLQLHDLAQNL